MATLNLKDFSTLVSDQVTAIQGRAAALVDFTVGSLMLAITQSNASVAQWLQQLILNLLATTRAATCSGADLDSWMADFGFTRLSAVQASGQVAFARFTPGNAALIPLGAIVATMDGSQQYNVIADSNNPAFNATLRGYLLPAGTAALTVPVLASTAGAAGNALAGTVGVIVGSIAGVDTVSNAAAFANGQDPETDAAFRARFVQWVSSLSKATKSAIGYALASMQQGVTYTLTENQDYNGNTLYGFFYAVVDDGSGNPPASFLSAAASAIDAVRPFTSRFAVFPPQVVGANVALALTTDPSGNHNDVVQQVSAALQKYIAGLKLGQLLPYTQLVALAYGASPLVTNVSGVLLNGASADLAANQKQVIRPGTITVN
ncbi:baseplate J/gp47 family protein [Paludibacterium purpuratum]|uniref:Putative phage protein gp47/JayE n=1 Tax=Paludibacterium purpuratum TaxID=1144873 RepID=A0A4R7B886_9NEIS|nr:baseplate J/gp47 family protein [Paludibacterium purpuratum]TDR79995.1 putative phage protein gp47/JayE [Paludibacterium purpuratum]